MMEFVEGFANSEVLEAVHQRTDKVKIARTAKVEEIMVEKRREMLAAAEVAATVAALVALVAAIEKRKEINASAEVAAAVAMAVAIEKRRTTAIEKRKEREVAADAVVSGRPKIINKNYI